MQDLYLDSEGSGVRFSVLHNSSPLETYVSVNGKWRKFPDPTEDLRYSTNFPGEEWAERERVEK